MSEAGMSAEDVGITNAIAEAERDAPPSQKLPPGEWVRRNLFNSVLNSVLTVVFGGAIVWVAFLAIGWAVDAEWKIIRTFLRVFMVGRFPNDELWRPWVSAYAALAAVGLASGAMAHNRYDDSLEKGLPAHRPTWWELIRRFWAIGLVVLFFLSFARTLLPYLGVALAAVVLAATREAGWRAPVSFRSRAGYVAGVLVLVSMMVLAGTSRLGGLAMALLAAVWATSELGRRDVPPSQLVKIAAPLAAAVVAFVAVVVIPFDGFGWDDWGGFHLTLFVTVIGIAVGMPFGILLALGRRSELPIVKAASVLFIEFVRGVPLISLLLFSNLMLGLFFPLGATIPGDLTLAMIVITGFSAAYIAEIVRGGLAAVPRGQTEAAQAGGMSPTAIQRLIVLPQALRAVIPAMVGQFIALFKDTSLLSIIGLTEFLRVTDIANANTEFVGRELQVVTYVFVAIGYWGFAYTMSKESRRLETRLGVGTR